MPKSCRLKCGEFQDGNFKPLITKIHEERRYLDLFLCDGSRGGSFYPEVLGALHTYTTEKNRTIGAESLTICMCCKWKIVLYVTRMATTSPESSGVTELRARSIGLIRFIPPFSDDAFDSAQLFRGELQSKNKLGPIDRVLEEIRNGEGLRVIRWTWKEKTNFQINSHFHASPCTVPRVTSTVPSSRHLR